jgi:general secretion pathway protein H
MLVVLVVLALALGVSVPLLTRPTGDAVLMTTAQNMASTMRLARAAAIRDNEERTMTLDLGRRLDWVDGLTAASPIAGGINVDFVTLQREQLRDQRGRLRFFVDGSATGGNIILRSGGRMVAVELDWASGHARLRRSR